MAPKLSAGVSVKGAIAYQDDADPTQFHYFPSAPRLTLEDNLEAYSVKYWGIGEQYLSQDAETGDGSSGRVRSLVGATVSGQVIFDNTSAEKDRLKKEIQTIYGIDKPKLIPVRLMNVKVVPVFAGSTLGITSDGEATWPEIAEVGSSVAYNVANGSGKFAQLFANVVATGGDSGLPNPDFALQVYGDIDFVADPWKVIIEANLSKVWEFVRQKFSAEATIGWFSLGKSEFENVMQTMQQEQIVKIRYVEGSPDSKDPGIQLFEQGKLLFEAVNQQITAGEGVFKIEPNPTPPDPPSGGGSVLPWGIHVSGSYQRSFFKQEIKWKRELEYAGRALRRFPSSIVLAVTCGEGTEGHFFDLSAPKDPCITQAKIDKMQNRLKKERTAQDQVVKAATKDVEKGKITNDSYNQVMGYLQNNSLTEDVEESSDGASLHGLLRRNGGRRWRPLEAIPYEEVIARALP